MHYAPANSIFSGPVTLLPSVYMFDGSPFTCQCEKEIGKADEFQIQCLYWPFLSGIMAFRRVKLVASMSWGNCWSGFLYTRVGQLRSKCFQRRYSRAVFRRHQSQIIIWGKGQGNFCCCCCWDTRLSLTFWSLDASSQFQHTHHGWLGI